MHLMYGGIAQLARAPALQAGGHRFESGYLHHVALTTLKIGIALIFL